MDERRSAMEVLRGSRILAYTVGVVAVAAGVVLLFWPDRTIVVVARLAGVLIAIVGIGEAIEAVTTRERGSSWGLLLLRGLINLAVGAVLVAWPGITVTVLVWIFGLNLIVTGVIGLVAASGTPRELGKSSLIARSVVAIAFGVLIVAWPGITLWVVTVIVALQLLILGIVLFWSGYQLTRLERDAAAG